MKISPAFCQPTALFIAALSLAGISRASGAPAPAAAPSQTEMIDRLFRSLDKNGDGKLSTNELTRRRLFQAADKDGDGFVTLEEARTGLAELVRQWQARSFPAGDGEEESSTNAAPGAAKSPRQGPRPLRPSDCGVGKLVPDLAFKDIEGQNGRLRELQRRGPVVIAFYSASCPVSKRYAPTLAGLEKNFKGVSFLFVDPIQSDTTSELRAARRAHGFLGPVVQDTQSLFTQALGARSTTDVFVLDGARTLIYRGAVDDQYGLGYSLEAPRHRYLAAALESLLAGGRPVMAATEAPGCALEINQATAKALPQLTVTYHNGISRLIQEHCLDCHRAGGVAPFSLATYDDVIGHAGMIRKQVERGAMPPWFAVDTATEAHSPWSNDRSLSRREKSDLLNWLDGGRPAGDAADAPLPRTFPGEWAIGQPDAIVQIPKPITVAATGTMPYQDVRVATSLTEDKWIQAVEVQPTARQVVHHVLVFVRAPGSNERTEARRRVGDEEREGFFAVYVPGNNSVIYPEGFAKRLPAGATLKFQIHYTPNGSATNDQTRLGLLFAKEPPQHVVHVIGLVNPLLAIPPGAANHAETAEIPIPRAARVLALMPHMHLRGKAFRFEATFEDGRKEVLLDVPHYDFNWQLAYRYADPFALPRGSRLVATGWYDNSADNPANPDPNKLVHWGPQTTDEMMLGYVEYYFPTEKPKALAQQQ